jgi:glycosyltransferase involved in cell wall biosynthesis
MTDIGSKSIRDLEYLSALRSETSAPLVSIVIPAYNVAPYICEAVYSALEQTLSNIEVIVVDDGSTDFTPKILHDIKCAYDDPRLRIVSQENGGLSAARNTGIRNAHGAFIGFLDGDDIWAPEKAKLQVGMMLADETIGISFSHSEFLTEDGRRTGSILIAEKTQPSLHDMIRRNHVGDGSSPIVRRKCFEIAGLFREELQSCEDYEMWCRILWLTPYRAQLLPMPLTFYRLRESSLSFNSAKFVENADRAIGCLRDTMTKLPQRVIRTGHAEHYRIAAWKAVSSGRHMDALRLLTRAILLHPMLLFSDWRAMGTAVSIILPESARCWLASKAKNRQRRRALHRTIVQE